MRRPRWPRRSRPCGTCTSWTASDGILLPERPAPATTDLAAAATGPAAGTPARARQTGNRPLPPCACHRAPPQPEAQPMTEGTSRIRPETLSALLASGEPSRSAFIVPDGGQTLTYAQVTAGIGTLAQRLAGAGVRRGDRVALTLPNGPDFVLLLLAITALGAAAAPLNPAYTQAEFDFFLTDIAPRLFLIPASRPAAAADAAAGTQTPVLTVG